MAARFLTSFALLVVSAFFVAYATDPNQLDDFCVATNDSNNAVLGVQGKMCKNPSEVTADDFLFRGLNVHTSERNSDGVHMLPASIPGLNTLGISVIRGLFSPSGGFMPHIHQRATEAIVVLEGTLYVGFVSFNQSDNSAKLFSKVIHPGDVFVIPQALVHFVYNIGETEAAILAVFSSQNPGYTAVAPSLFGALPPISGDLLSKAFKLDAAVVKDLQSKF